MGVDLNLSPARGVARKARIAAAIACTLVIAAGAVVLQSQLRLARLAHAAIDEDAVRGRGADRAAVSALQCRRYDVEFNLLASCLLVVLPSGIIVAWTIWLTNEIIARNNKLADAKRAAESANCQEPVPGEYQPRVANAAAWHLELCEVRAG